MSLKHTRIGSSESPISKISLDLPFRKRTSGFLSTYACSVRPVVRGIDGSGCRFEAVASYFCSWYNSIIFKCTCPVSHGPVCAPSLIHTSIDTLRFIHEALGAGRFVTVNEATSKEARRLSRWKCILCLVFLFLFASNRSHAESGLVAAYGFEEGSGDTVAIYPTDEMSDFSMLVVKEHTGLLNAAYYNRALTASEIETDMNLPVNAPAISIGDVTVTEGDNGTTQAVFTVTLSAASEQDVTVDYQTADDTANVDSDYDAETGTLTISKGKTTREIKVKVNGDTEDEIDEETFLVNLTNPTNATIADAQGRGTIRDDDNDAVNDPPVVTDIPDQTIDEDGSFAVINLDNYVADFDNTDAEMIWTYSGNTKLAVNVDANRVAAIVTPSANWHGSETITFNAEDPGGLTGAAEATFTVTAVSDAPANISPPVINGIFEESQLLKASQGVWTNNANPPGAITYTYQWRRDANGNEAGGEDDIPDATATAYTVTAADMNHYLRVVVTATANDESTVAVSGPFGPVVNSAPRIDWNPIPATVTMSEDGWPMPWPDPALTASDLNTGDRATLAWQIVDPPLHGAASVSGEGVSPALTYSPHENFHGNDSFTVQVSDGDLTDTIRVNVIVVMTDDRPVANGVGSLGTAEESPREITLDDLSATDPDDPDYSYPEDFTLTVHDGPNYSRVMNTITPAMDFNGTLTVPVRVNNPKNAIVLQLDAGADPDLAGYKVYYKTDSPGNRVLANYDGTGLEYGPYRPEGTKQPVDSGFKVEKTALENLDDDIRSVELPISGLIAGIKYYFVVTVYDNNDVENESDASNEIAAVLSPESNVVNLSVEVTPVNDKPTISDITNSTTDEDMGTNPISFTVGDMETDPGLLTLTGRSSYPALVPDANIVFGGSGANRTVTVSPAADRFGSATITVSVSDGADQTTDTFVLTVNAVNDTPSISDIADLLTDEDTATGNIAFNVGDAETAAEALNVTAVSSNQAMVPGTGISLGGTGSNRTLSITPTANRFGQTAITVTVDDGIASVSDTFLLMVRAVNDEPVIVGTIPDQTQDEDAAAWILDLSPFESDVEDNGTDLDWSVGGADPSLFTAIITDSDNDILTITPVAHAHGSDRVTLSLTDSGGRTISQDITITLNAVNDAPVVNNVPGQRVAEGGAFAPVNLNDLVNDPDNTDAEITWRANGQSALTIRVDAADRMATINIPDENWNGSETVTFTAEDPGGLTSSSEATFTATAVNDAPTMSNIANQVIDEDTTTGAIAFTVGDVETTPENLTVFGSSSDPAIVPDANIVFGGNGANRTVTVSPAADRFGSATITVSVSDGADQTTDTFVLTVNAVNDTPSISDIADLGTDEDTATGNIAFNVGDAETAAEALNVTAVSSNQALVPGTGISLGGTGSNRTLSITPAVNRFGQTAITVTVGDGTASISDTFLLTVRAVNDEPVIVGTIPDQTQDEDAVAWILDLSPFESDVEDNGTDLDWRVGGVDPSLFTATITDSDNDILTITPVAHAHGSDRVRLSLTDSGGRTISQDITITLNAVNDAPVVSNVDGQRVAEGGAFATVNLDDYVSDVDNTASEIIWRATGQSELTVTIDANRVATITVPHIDWFGAETITFTATDPGGRTDEDAALFTVTPATLFVEPNGFCSGRVPCYPAIQRAIDASGDAATIMVARGTYTENISVRSAGEFILEGGWDSSFTENSLDPTTTVIDGNGREVFYLVPDLLPSGEKLNITIEGFTIRNGDHRQGGSGSGIYLSYPLGQGHRIDLTLQYNIIKENNGAEGGAIYIDNNGGLMALTLLNNVIADNHAIQNGSGIHTVSRGAGATDLILINNTIADNISETGGSGMFLDAVSPGASITVMLTNTILWGNRSLPNMDSDLLITSGPGGVTVKSSHNDIKNLTINGGTYVDLGGNVSATPDFSDPGNSGYRLSYSSPLVDAGTNTNAPLFDIEGDSRPHDGDGDGTGIVDIGADESFNEAPMADAGPDQKVNEGDPVTLDGSNASDPENDPLTFQWTQVSGPLVSLSNPNAERPTFTAPDAGDTGVILTFRLTVTDPGNRGAQDLCNVEVTVADTDGDGVRNSRDAFPDDPGEWVDTDNDGTGDNTDTDDDNDGIPDEWELQHGLDPLVDDANEDADGDGITNIEEYRAGASPITADKAINSPQNDQNVKAASQTAINALLLSP